MSQRTTILFGGVPAEVSLTKMSGSPTAAKHDTRRVETPAEPSAPVTDEATPVADVADGAPIVAEVHDEVAASPAGLFERTEAEEEQLERGKVPERVAAGVGATAPAIPDVESSTRAALESARALVGDAPDPPAPSSDPLAAETPPPPDDGGFGKLPDQGTPAQPVAPTDTFTMSTTTETRHGVYLDGGEWVDLTDELAAIDARTKIDGMEVIRCVPSSAVPRARVRDAHWVNLAEPVHRKVLAALWHALASEDRAALVVWTKRTNQALGIIVAVHRPKPALALYELEWAANMRKAPPKATGAVTAELTKGERDGAIELVQALAAPASAVDELEDQRLAKRAELLDRARSGELKGYTPPAEPTPTRDVGEDGLADALLRAALDSATAKAAHDALAEHDPRGG